MDELSQHLHQVTEHVGILDHSGETFRLRALSG
jgi:hypothetical protein